MRKRGAIGNMINEMGVALAIFTTTRNPFDYLLFRAHIRKSAMMLPKSGSESRLFLLPGSATLTYMGKRLAFEYNSAALRIVPLALMEIFTYEPYKELKVRGREVVDVGASVGDTAIYFLTRGARKVYCFDRDAYRISVLRRNLKRNRLQKYVKVFQGEFDARKLKLKGSKNSLKVDCEGCEYSLFDPSGAHLDYITSRFSQIVMEFHRGDREIRKALEQRGYRVRSSGNGNGRGILYARKANRRNAVRV